MTFSNSFLLQITNIIIQGMMIRTACFILTVLLPSPYRWIALFGAVTLPYIAVIAANAGRETIKKDAIFTPKRKRLN